MTDGATREPVRRGVRPMTIVRLAFVAVAVGLGVHAIARDLPGFRAAITVIGPGRALGAFGLVVAGLLVSSEAWRLAIASVAGPLRADAARGLFFVSQLGKYVPGGVWTIAAQMEMAKRYGLGRASMGVGSLLFLAFHMATGILVAAALLPLATPGLVGQFPWVLLVVVAAVVGLLPPVLRRSVTVVLRLLRQETPLHALRGQQVLAPVAWMLLVWVAFGAATFVVSSPLLDEGSQPALLAACAGGFALAWVVGVLVIPAPAGVGAREVAFVFALAPMLGVTAATSVAVILRVVHTASDLSLALLMRWAERSRSPTSE